MDTHMALANSAFATRQNYLRGLKVLMLHFQRLPEECTVDEIKTFLVYQRDNLGIASSTLNVRVCSLKYYFRHIANRLDLVVKIPNPRVAKFNTEIFTPAEMNLLFSSCRDLRQLIIVRLIYDCGLRISEVVRLRACDFDKSDRTITIRNSKGQKTRVVFYGKQLQHDLNQYAKTIGVGRQALIESYKSPHQPLSIRGLQHIVKEIIRRSGIKKRASSHTIRHTFAVHYLNNGGSIFALSLLLGHSHLSITLAYLKYAKLPDSPRISILDQMTQKS